MSCISKYHADHGKFSEPERQTLGTQWLFFYMKKNELGIYFETVKFCLLNHCLKTQLKEELIEIAISLTLVTDVTRNISSATRHFTFKRKIS